MIAPAQSLVLVGSGLAAWTVVRELRKLDAHSPITLICRDSGDFYSKPLLSTALASGKTAAQLVGTTSAAMAQTLQVNLMANTEVTSIEPARAEVHTRAGVVAYSRLVLALGADPVRLSLQGDAAERVLSVNDLQDYARFREHLAAARRVAVMGAGLIGCEFANDLVLAGHEVDVIDPGTQPLGRLLPPDAGAAVQQALADAGVRFHFGTSVQAVDAKGEGLPIWCSRPWACARAPRWRKRRVCRWRAASSSTASCKPVIRRFTLWATWPRLQANGCPLSCP